MNGKSLAIILPLLLIGCGSESTSPEEPTLNGIWKSPCKTYTESTNVGYSSESLEFSNGYYQKTTNYYSDNECSHYLNTESIVGNYELKREIIRASDNQSFHADVLKISITSPNTYIETHYTTQVISNTESSTLSYWEIVQASEDGEGNMDKGAFYGKTIATYTQQ